MKPGRHVKQRANFQRIADAISALGRVQVMVGVPAEETERRDGEVVDEHLTNAYLAFIHDQGAPEANIPARPFMEPGMALAQDAVTRQLEGAARAAASGNMMGVAQRMTAAGLAASSSIKRYIDAGIDPPLADRTLRMRAAKGSKGAALELAARKEGRAASTLYAKPLIVTGQLRNSITHVLRTKERK